MLIESVFIVDELGTRKKFRCFTDNIIVFTSLNCTGNRWNLAFIFLSAVPLS